MPPHYCQSDHCSTSIVGYVVQGCFCSHGLCSHQAVPSIRENIYSWKKQVNSFFLTRLLVTWIYICLHSEALLLVVCMSRRSSALFTCMFILDLAFLQTHFPVKDRNHKLGVWCIEIYFYLFVGIHELLNFLWCSKTQIWSLHGQIVLSSNLQLSSHQM